MKLKNNYSYRGIKVVIIGIRNCESRIVLISPVSDTKYDWTCELDNFYLTRYDIKDLYKNRKYAYGIDRKYLSVL